MSWLTRNTVPTDAWGPCNGCGGRAHPDQGGKTYTCRACAQAIKLLYTGESYPYNYTGTRTWPVDTRAAQPAE